MIGRHQLMHLGGVLCLVTILWASVSTDFRRREQHRMTVAFQQHWPWRAEVVDLFAPDLYSDSIPAELKQCDAIAFLVAATATEFPRWTEDRGAEIDESCMVTATWRPTVLERRRSLQIAGLDRFRAVTGILEVPTLVIISKGSVRCIGIGDLAADFRERCGQVLSRDEHSPLVHRGKGAVSIIQASQVQ
jgi:hypothetical protein